MNLFLSGFLQEFVDCAVTQLNHRSTFSSEENHALPFFFEEAFLTDIKRLTIH